jgi:hypothetical protein
MPATRKAVPGDTQIEKRLWNTYMHWARAAAAPEIDPTLEISKAANRLPAAHAQALQAILFSAFVLEFRLKLVYDYLGIAFRKRDTLGSLLQHFRTRLEQTPRLDTGRPIRFPVEWGLVERRLRALVTLRNDIAHANQASVLLLLGKSTTSLKVEARRSFNAVVDAIRIIHRATGNESMSLSETRTHYRRLSIRRDGA